MPTFSVFHKEQTNVDKTLFRAIKHSLAEHSAAAAELSGTKQVILLRTEMQFRANL